ncbi:MAG TPA: hypothetical protein VFC26_07050 [Verrucomicrobiae bacterium]|nr:hypothetical protein [Verrucomicrobiae bacterium]
MAQAETLSVAGFVVRGGLSSAPYTLQNSRYGDTVAALADPRDILREGEWSVLHVETTGMFAGGLPVFEAVEVLPEYWQQPALFRSPGKDFGTWTGVGSRAQPKDYAGAPLEDRRAYHIDNGLESLMLHGGGSGGSHPPVILRAQLTPRGLQLTWNVQAGSQYDVLGSGQLGSGHAVMGNVTADDSGTVSLMVPTTGSQRFFKIRY